MNNLTKNILLKFDEINRYETPSNFDYKELESRVVKLTKELESLFETKFKVDNNVQDASFYCDIITPHELVIHPKSNYLYSIRISNFGNLATIGFDDSYSDKIKAKFIETLKENNFTYISSNDLEEDYDGNFDKFNEILGGQKPHWWNRYFDYL